MSIEKKTSVNVTWQAYQELIKYCLKHKGLKKFAIVSEALETHLKKLNQEA
jgi:hypothetical protein